MSLYVGVIQYMDMCMCICDKLYVLLILCNARASAVNTAKVNFPTVVLSASLLQDGLPSLQSPASLLSVLVIVMLFTPSESTSSIN